MKLAALLAGALIATPAMPAFALPEYFQAGGILDASTGIAGNGSLIVGPSSGDFQAIGLDYKGTLHVVVNVSSLPDPTNTTRFTPSLELLIDGSERHFVDFLEFYDSRDDQRTLSLGTNEIDWPFDLRTQIYPAPEQVTVSAIVKAVVRDSDCCVVDSISAFAAGDLTVYFTDPPASVAEPPSGLLLLAGVLGLSGAAMRRSVAETHKSRRS